MANVIRDAFTWRAIGWPLGLMRILYGILWWEQSRWKVPPSFGWPGAGGDGGGLWYWLNQMIQHPTFAWHKAFLEHVVVPNFLLFGWMTLFTETFIAVTLTLGLLTRLGALIATGFALNITFGIVSVPHEWVWTYVMLVGFAAIFCLTGAGRSLGLDQLLAPAVEREARRGSLLARLFQWAM